MTRPTRLWGANHGHVITGPSHGMILQVGTVSLWKCSVKKISCNRAAYVCEVGRIIGEFPTGSIVAVCSLSIYIYVYISAFSDSAKLVQTCPNPSFMCASHLIIKDFIDQSIWDLSPSPMKKNPHLQEEPHL